jgi:SPP1 family predicted phage head-tail adaptor
MRAGKLSRQISIIQPSVTGRSTDGEPIFSWSTILSGVWADRVPLSGREVLRMDTRWPEITTRFIMRYSSLIDPRCRILDLVDNYQYDIKAILRMDNKRAGLEIIAVVSEFPSVAVVPPAGAGVLTESGVQIILEDGSSMSLEG